MNRFFTCRRTFVSIFGMVLCLVIALILKIDTTMAIMGIVIGLSSANGIEGVANKVGAIFTQK